MDIERQGGRAVAQIDRNTPRKCLNSQHRSGHPAAMIEANNLAMREEKSSHGFRERRPA
jgi:hypothetical protein